METYTQKLNPADYGTRGLKPSEFEEKWLQGPKFLFQDPENWNFDQTKFFEQRQI